MVIENVKVIKKLDLQQGTGSNGKDWKNQQYIVQGQGQYDKPICVECFGQNADKVVLEEGQIVSLNVDIESREFNGRWFTSVRAWNVKSDSNGNAPATPASPAAPVASPAAAPAQPATQAPSAPAESTTQLPF